MLALPQNQATIGELCVWRDGIRNAFKLCRFSVLSTAGPNVSSPVWLGSPAPQQARPKKRQDRAPERGGSMKRAGPTSRDLLLRRHLDKRMTMAHWLMKSEPESYSWSDLVRDGGTEWDGVRNNAARLHLKAMKEGDEAFFYHSMSDKAVVGIMRIAREAQPDPKDASWVSVRVVPVRALARPITLAEIKAEPRLARMELIRQSRLSVAPVRDEEWKVVLELAGA